MSLVNQTSFVGLSPGLPTTSSELEAELEAEFRFEITEPFETIELIVLFNLSLSGDVDGSGDVCYLSCDYGGRAWE